MKYTLLVLLSAASLPLFAADNTIAPAAAVFPPELVFLASERINMTQEQQEAFQDRVQKTRSRSEELRLKLEHEAAALAPLTSEEAILAQLDKVRSCVEEMKQLHIEFGVAATRLLTPEQQTKLMEIAKGAEKGSEGFHQLEEAAGKRIAGKIERVQLGVQGLLSDSARDAIQRAMEGTVEPLLKADRPMEVEAALDRVLKQLNSSPDAKLIAPTAGSAAIPADSAEMARKRISEKVEEVKAGAHKLTESGRDFSAIAQAMEERFKPLLGAGKLIEAEAELDRVLELLKQE
jgi:Spy/CpxP family protein refolding chaperone